MKRYRESGFTLIELLVGLAVLGAMVILMTAGYQVIAATWQRVDHRDAAIRELQSAQEVVGHLIARAYPGFVGEAHQARTVAFTGTAESLEFMAPLPDRFGAPALVWYDLLLAPDGSLHLSWRFDRGDSADTILMTDLIGGRLAYFGTMAGGARGWSDHWSAQSSLPEVVRLHLARRDGQSETWPDLMVAPAITATIECNFDPADGKCRPPP